MHLSCLESFKPPNTQLLNGSAIEACPIYLCFRAQLRPLSPITTSGPVRKTYRLLSFQAATTPMHTMCQTFHGRPPAARNGGNLSTLASMTSNRSHVAAGNTKMVGGDVCKLLHARRKTA